MKLDYKRGTYIEVEDISLYVEQTGQIGSTAIVLLHGGLGNMQEFNPLLEALPQHFHYIAIDFRGHGLSPLSRRPLNYQLYQEDVAQVCRHLGIERYFVLGYSDGGITGLRLAIEEQNKVLGLIAIGAHGQIDQADSGYQIFSKMNETLWRDYFPESVEVYEKQNPTPNFSALSSAVFSMWRSLEKNNYPQSQIERIQCPVLVARGEQDHLYTQDNMQSDKSMIHDCQSMVFKGAQHDAHIECSHHLAEAMCTFVKAVTLKRNASLLDHK